MPGFDGTGPRGEGPMTGGGRGFCNPGWAAYGPGYGRRYAPGWGRGYGRGFGWRRAYPAWGPWPGAGYAPYYGGPYAMGRDDEINMLKGQAEMLRQELDTIQKRMEELESEASD